LPYVLNTRRDEAKHRVLYANIACFVNTVTCFVTAVTLNMYVSLSYTGLTRWNTGFVFLWLRHRNTIEKPSVRRETGHTHKHTTKTKQYKTRQEQHHSNTTHDNTYSVRRDTTTVFHFSFRAKCQEPVRCSWSSLIIALYVTPPGSPLAQAGGPPSTCHPTPPCTSCVVLPG